MNNLNTPEANETNADAVRQTVSEIKESLATNKKSILEPILTRLALPDGLTGLEVDWESNAETAHHFLERFQTQIKELKTIADEARDAGLDININDWENEEKLLRLKTNLAWDVSDSKTGILKSAIDEADRIENESQLDSDTALLKSRAKKRYEFLTEKSFSISSSGAKAQALEDLISVFSGNDLSDDIPIKQINEIQQALAQAFKDVQVLEVGGIREIRDEYSGADISLSLVGVKKDLSKKVRETVITVITLYRDKAIVYKDESPKTAKKWFEPVNILSKLLDDTQDEGWIKEITLLGQEIEEDCNRWDVADTHLKAAQDIFKNPSKVSAKPTQLPWGEIPYWTACTLVKQAWEAFPAHRNIRPIAEEAVDKIYHDIKAQLDGEIRNFQEYWPNWEASIIEMDWSNHHINRKELPAWLLNQQELVKSYDVKIKSLPVRFENAFGQFFLVDTQIYFNPDETDAPGKYKNLDEYATTKRDERVIKPYTDLQDFIGFEVSKRIQIRSKVWELQVYLDNAKPAEAQEKNDAFCQANPTWKNDVEIIEIGKQINERLELPELIQKARSAFVNHNLDECISTSQVIINREKMEIRGLGKEIDETYLAAHLGADIGGDIPGGAKIFVPIMYQLAMIYHAAEQVVKSWSAQDYHAAKASLDIIVRFAAGGNPLLEARKAEINFSEKLEEWDKRNQFGNQNYAKGVSFNHLADQFQNRDMKLKEHAPTKEWLEQTKQFLTELLDFDQQAQTIWVAKRLTWLDEISKLFLQNTSAWILSIQGNSLQLEVNQQLAYDCVSMLRRTKKFYNLDSQQRRWAIFSYYAGQIQKFAPDEHEKIVGLWRRAVAELPDDNDVIQKFIAARWNCWLSLLDDELEEVANNRNHPVDDWNKLIQPDTLVAGGLFEPIKIENGTHRDYPLDINHLEIRTRKDSYQFMRQAEVRLSEGPGNLEFVIRDLENESAQLKRNELLLMAQALVSNFIFELIRLGDQKLGNNSINEATTEYIKAYYYAAKYKVSAGVIEKCTQIINNHRRDIETHWRNLSIEIKESDISTGTIQQQIKIALDAQLALKSLDIISKNNSFKFNGLPASMITINQRISDLNIYLMYLEKFSPDNPTWQKAMKPDGDLISRSAAWGQLKRYLEGIRLNGQEQVKALTELKEKIQSGVEQVVKNKNFLEQSLKNHEIELDDLLEYCFLINTNAKMLAQKEKDYHIIWREWREEKDDKKHPLFYADTFPAYANWNFEFAETEKRTISLPYFKDLDHFNRVDSWLAKFLTINQSNGQVSFLPDEWRKVWKEKRTEMDMLIEQYQKGQHTLVDFILVALYDQDYWNSWNIKAIEYKEKLVEIRKEIINNNRSWMTNACKDQINSLLDAKKQVFEEVTIKENLTSLSEKLRNDLIDIIQKIDEDEHKNKLSFEIHQDQAYFNELKNSFYRSFGQGNVLNKDGQRGARPILEKLIFYTGHETFSWDDALDKLVGINRERLESCYDEEIKPLYEFFRYTASKLDVI